MIIIVDGEGRRLCQDNVWRGFANFGTTPECVRIYRRMSAARTKARRTKGGVAQLPEGAEIDAAGTVFHNNTTHNVTHYIIK